MSDADDAELRALIGQIERTFAQDLDAWLACFARPVVFVTPAGTLALADDDAARNQFRPMFDALVSRGFESTAADRIEMRSLGRDVALVDASFTRRLADGSVMERVGALYVCRRESGVWKVAALVAHDADVAAIDAIDAPG